MKRPKFFSRKSKGQIALYLFVSFLFTLVAISYVYLLVWAVIAGAKTHNEVVLTPFALPETWNWKNYLDVFSLLEVGGNNFFNMLFNSVYFSLAHTFLAQFTTMTFAYCCTKYEFPGSKLPYLIILIMMTLPIYGTGGAMYKIYHALGWINSYAIVLTSAGGFTMNFLYYRAYYQNMSWSYAEAAMIDGAGDFQIYSKVMFPLGKPIFGALFLASWLANWNSYSSELIYTPKLPTLPVGIYQFNTEMLFRARLDILFAACVMICLPALILFTVFNKTITTSVSVGGLKG